MQPKTLTTLALIALTLAGCGAGDPRVAAVSKQAASESCMGCHTADVSPGTGARIVEEWQGSVHNTANAAGCADCHEPAPGHPNQCNKCHGGGGSPTGYEVTRKPDAAQKCAKCHGLALPGDIMVRLAPQHFGNMTATAQTARSRASYANSRYLGRCTACHNPHVANLTDEHKAYATSAHGDVNGVAFATEDFKTNAACIRCHTTTGFKQYVADFVIPTAPFGAGDYTREVIACDACHGSYDYKNSVRPIAAVSAPYNGGQSPALFPDTGKSNLCIACHTGRESGDTINAIPAASFGNVGFKNSHYLAAAGLMYMKVGFTSFTSPSAPFGTSTYGKSLSPDDASTPGGIPGGTASTHRKFGTPLINGDSHAPTFFVAGVFDKNGPCVTCHLSAYGVPLRSAAGHSLKIDANAYRQVCVNCHTSENTVPLTADNFREVFLKPQSEAFHLSLDVIKELLLEKYRISYDETAFPYFYDENLAPAAGKKQPVKDWTRGGTVNGRKLMGACFNLNLLNRDPAAFAHARSYSRRLVYDSIDFLDDGVMNASTGATAVASGVKLADGVTPAFVKDTQAYNTANGAITTIYGNTSEAMLYLIGWSRSTGKWNAIERP